jgi:hypothetical protein
MEAGAAIDVTETAKASYGPSTASAVAAYQKAHGLTADGICGPKTWSSILDAGAPSAGPPGWKLGPVPAVLQSVMDKSLALVGTIESPPGSNRGPVIDGLNRAAGIPVGSPWCAAFATGMYAYCATSPFARPLGSALKIKTWGEDRKCVVKAASPVIAGDIFVIMRNASNGHVGLVAADLGDSVATIEGNAGNMVKQLIRRKADMTAFVRPLGLSLKV